jgi:hypothetical protein
MKVKIITAYKADMDGFYSSVQLVQIDKTHVDNEHTYFKSFNAAKKRVVTQLKDMVVQYKNNLAVMKALKAENLVNSNI